MKTVDAIKFYPDVLKEFLDFYSNGVDIGIYTKIDYMVWRFLVRSSKENKEVFVYNDIDNSKLLVFDNQSASEKAEVPDFYTAIWSFPGNTCSCQYTIKEKENNDMNYNDIETKGRTTSSYEDDFVKGCNKTTAETIKPTMNFDFGPISDGVAISPYGLAIRASDGKWLTYNPANHQTVDVTGFIFNFKGMIYKMPVAISAIAVGDLIVHQRKPMYVTDVTDSNIEVVDILSSEAKKIIPVTNMFGFNFITKITSIVNLGTTTPSPEQPFGNIMPMIMADMVFGGNDESSAFGNMDMSKLAMISMMTGNANPFGSLFNFGGIAGSAPTGDSK